MKDMFYNYDHHIDEKYHIKQPIDKEPDKLVGYSGLEVVRDWKDNEIGIRVHQGAPITLFFDFCGDIDGDTNIESFLNSNVITLQIVDRYHTTILETTYNNQVKDNSLEAEIIDVDKKLRRDIYYIKLYITQQTGEMYTLFSEDDATLFII